MPSLVTAGQMNLHTDYPLTLTNLPIQYLPKKWTNILRKECRGDGGEQRDQLPGSQCQGELMVTPH